MIADNIKNAATYTGLHRGIAKALNYLSEISEENFQDGKVVIDGDAVFALHQSYSTNPEAGREYESHVKYIDVQYIADGGEIIKYAEVSRLAKSVEYDIDKDCAFFKSAPGSDLVLKAGDFAVFFPHDAHMPTLMNKAPGNVKKIVVKVAVE